MNDQGGATPQPTRPGNEHPSRRAALLRSPRFQGHETGAHPENPFRLAAIDDELIRADLLANRPEITFGPAENYALTRVHDGGYVAMVEALAEQGGGSLDGDTPVAADSFEVARLAAGATIAAVDAALTGRVQRSFALVRPPGHHATPRRGMGFCLFNNVAVGAAHALAQGVSRVLIIDWDVHHGNGTQDAFYETDQVFFCSIHQSPLYPGTGAATERGRGKGEGFTLNVPLPPGQGDDIYCRTFDQTMLPVARAYRPELVMISAGFDAHEADPLAWMRVTTAGFGALAKRVVDLAQESASGRVVAVLEGGYDPSALAQSVATVVRVLDDHPADGAGTPEQK